MGNLVSGSAERPGNPIDAAEIPIVRDNDVAIGQGARLTERPEKTTASARHRLMTVGRTDRYDYSIYCTSIASCGKNRI